ncbi:homoserine kinase [Clostridium frigidicarnis]|uniref:Homoserine kinase n=1 Tax=Clostridium frigidicarnis TaxID=84698 RepID=A0A1I0YW25_9CLOT|nr:homoserine kinase [Clostridium frigidicarnis]SFB17227.1 homoserine kinase [Clostridium frigidicarnis]
MLEIKVPATSANFGPGFDALGVALDLYNKFYIEEIEEGLVIEGCDEKYRGKDNLIYRAMEECFKITGYNPKGIHIKIKSEIPLSRGLGSSASCIVAGVLAANEISGNKLDKKEILNLATKIEGHPDNITPALFGGMTVSICDNDEVLYNQIFAPENICFCALIPEFTLSTEKARAVLPKEISYKDAVFNISRVSMLVSALSNSNLGLLKVACEDRIHQIYRGELIDNFDDIIKICNDLNCLGIFLSGAGPTVMALVEETNLEFFEKISEMLSNLNNKWSIKKLRLDNVGATLKKRNAE